MSDTESQRLMELLDAEELNLSAIRQCVMAGADVMYKEDKHSGMPLLGYFLVRRPTGSLTDRISTVEALLNSSNPIDFRIGDRLEMTVLHLLSCSGLCKRADSVEEVLTLIRRRVERHHEDVIEWDRINTLGDDPFSLAADSGYLSVWAKVLLHEHPIAFFTDGAPKTIPIRKVVQRRDWERMPAADQQWFELEAGIQEEE